MYPWIEDFETMNGVGESGLKVLLPRRSETFFFFRSKFGNVRSRHSRPTQHSYVVFYNNFNSANALTRDFGLRSTSSMFFS